MKHLLICLFLTALLPPAWSQSQPEAYQKLAAVARTSFEKGDYAAAAAGFSETFKSMGWKGYIAERYLAARAWAMSGVPDSAFFNLYRLAEKMNYSRFDELVSEPHFNSLHSDARWQPLCLLVKANQPPPPAMPELATELTGILEEDQKWRMMTDSVAQQFGRNSPEMSALYEKMQETDLKNTRRITTILDTHGWLGPKAIGDNGATALFLVVQHADLSVQEKYLPMMRRAVADGVARGADLALLEDRVLMRNGKKQIYGSQVSRNEATDTWEFAPIEDVDHVDERRAAVGLSPLADYARHFNITWDDAAKEKNKAAGGQKKP